MTLRRFMAMHNFKMGIESQHVKFSTLQPAWSRGQFDYNGSFHRYSRKTTAARRASRNSC